MIKSAFANLWSIKIVSMDPKSNLKILGDQFEYSYDNVLIVFFSFLDIRLLVDGYFLAELKL
jgi:hypothetical protein